MNDSRHHAVALEKLRSEDFPALLQKLQAAGYRLVGPSVKDGAILVQEIQGAEDLPRGWGEETAPGSYRLKKRNDDAYFGFTFGPQSWKRFLFPPRDPLIHLKRHGRSIEWYRPPVDEPPMAFIGVRPCDLAAIRIQDKVYAGTPFRESRYVARRRRAFLVAVNCLRPGELCFCDSMGTGPAATEGFDLCLTEMDGFFMVEAGSREGMDVLSDLPVSPVTREEGQALSQALEVARTQMGRQLDTHGLPGLLFGNIDHPRWEDVAKRCLTCGSCTHVCPTCFCFSVREVGTMVEEEENRERFWDSCFSLDHSMIHGGFFRATPKQRFRQWLTHKLGAWESQFGTSGCVGCGRCIAWCPVGIDITEEAKAIRADSRGHVRMPKPRTYKPQAGDPLIPSPAQVIHVREETPDTATLWMEPAGPFRFRPGQFNMLSIPGIGDVPISISGQDGAAILHTIRAVGGVTDALTSLEPGDLVGMRGPFGTSWPMSTARGRIVTVIAGGIGLAPLRGTIREMAERPDLYPSVRVLYGARTPGDVLYPEEIERWNRHLHMKASVTVDRAPPSWTGHVGVVTNFLRRKEEVRPDSIYLLCGPEIMMRVVIEELLAAGVPEGNIYVSLERNMKCGAGFCGRCQKGPFFICKDGPVFRYDQVSFVFTHAGL